MLEPRRKHTAMVIGVAIATIVGLIQGSKMEATTQSDFFALIIAFLIILGMFAATGFFIDKLLHTRHKKDYQSYIIQEEFNYGDGSKEV